MDSFQLKKRGSATAADGVYMQAGYFENVMKRHITNAMGKARADGFCPEDILIKNIHGGEGVGATDVFPTNSKKRTLPEDYEISSTDNPSDGNGIMYAAMCKADVNSKCFTSTNEKICEHKVNVVKLNTVGDFVVFPSRFFHRGYYTIASNMTYYTAQLFCKISDNPEAWQNVTRKVNQITMPGRVQESWLTLLTQDICNNWDTTYSVNAFPPAKAFDGDKIDATKNRHILSVMFQGVPWISELVKYFEEKYKHLEVRSVWMIEKSIENVDFQGWHRDFYFYLRTEVTTTIVVNVGAVTKN
jgi:hypothetical protein